MDEESTPKPTLICSPLDENKKVSRVFCCKDSIFDNLDIEEFFDCAKLVSDLSTNGFTVTSLYEYIGKKYVVRFVNNSINKFSLETEIKIYSHLQNAKYSYISNLIYADISNTKHRTSHFIFEYEEGYTLEEYIRTQPAISLEFASHFAKHMKNALESLHEHGILHHDIKPANIYIPTTTWIPQLLDFGEAIEFTPGELTPLSAEYCGSPRYSHSDAFPGPFTACQYMPSYDFYSVGIVLRDDLAPRLQRHHEQREVLLLAQCFLHHKK